MENRSKQVAFLEKIHAICKIHLIKEEEIKSPLQKQVYTIAARFMIAACIYVQSQIGSSKRKSALYSIIDDNLGVTDQNFLSDEDKEACYLTAERLMKTPQAFEHSNIALEKLGLPPFTEQEWGKFTDFLKKMCHKKEAKDQYTTFPVTSITQPLFGTIFSLLEHL